MKKKSYLVPVISVKEVCQETFMTESGVYGDGIDSTYGGLDKEGTKEPSSKSSPWSFMDN